jgi:hypothetical protein
VSPAGGGFFGPNPHVEGGAVWPVAVEDDELGLVDVQPQFNVARVDEDQSGQGLRPAGRVDLRDDGPDRVADQDIRACNLPELKTTVGEPSPLISAARR